MKFITKFLFCLALLSLTACQPEDSTNKPFTVGTIAGPETELMQVAKEVAFKKYQLNIEIVEFSDYALPNIALNDGSIDANVFQHLPYLQASIEARGYTLSSIGKTFIYPMGMYSKKIKSLDALADKSTVAVPNDPSNEARALLLLQKAQLITLRPNTSVTATVEDIAENPKQLVIREVDAAQLPRVLDDVAIAVINSNYAVAANLFPTRDAIFIEDHTSEYANVVVVRTDRAHDPKAKQLVSALHSREVLAKAHQLFRNQAIPAWTAKEP